MVDLKPKPAVWLGDAANIDAAGEVFHEWHPSLDVLHLSGALDFDNQVEAAELLESFARPVFAVFDSRAQASTGWELTVQAVDQVRHHKRLPVAVLLLDGLGRGLELAAMADVAFVLPTSRVGQYGARLESGQLATGWQWDGRRLTPGRHWNVSRERLTWLRDNSLGAEAAEHLLGLLPADDADHVMEVFGEVCRRHPRR
ncbi:hypothetical protein [Aeoliella sp.]|uniref:hypothetical protein n=1 Tax=Aeoliella sp. TaxID=2795800 RepID=UPI003CCBBD70